MIPTKLILIDGIIGSGKSTTAQFIAFQLQKNNIKAKWFHEYDPSNPLFEDPGNVEPNPERIVEKWQLLVIEAETSDDVLIVESYLFQKTIGNLFENNIDKREIFKCAFQIREQIKELNPVLIYFYQRDIEKALKRLYEVRGEDWVNHRIQYETNTPYGINNSLKEYRGWVTFWRDLKVHIDELIEEYKLKILQIETSASNWLSYRQKILDYLCVQLIKDKPISESYLTRFCGKYREIKSRTNDPYEFTISLETENLFLYGFIVPKYKLIPKENNFFYAESVPHILIFEESPENEITKLIFDRSALHGGKKMVFQKVS